MLHWTIRKHRFNQVYTLSKEGFALEGSQINTSEMTEGFVRTDSIKGSLGRSTKIAPQRTNSAWLKTIRDVGLFFKNILRAFKCCNKANILHQCKISPVFEVTLA